MAMAAKITDPLEKTPKFQRASARVRRIQDNRKQYTPEEYQRRLSKAKQDKKSIKNKFGDRRANIAEFDTQWMLDKVKEILSPDNKTNQMWELLHQSNSGVKDMLSGVNQAAEFMANNQQMLQQDAMRMSMLLGAPLPEKAADHVEVGDMRFEISREDRGRRSLRIERLPNSLAI
jgi:hypothetical protein